MREEPVTGSLPAKPTVVSSTVSTIERSGDQSSRSRGTQLHDGEESHQGNLTKEQQVDERKFWPTDPLGMTQTESAAYAHSLRLLTKAGERPLVKAKVISLMRSDNYKVIMSIGRTVRTMQRRPVLVDTGAGPNFIRQDAVPKGRNWPMPKEENHHIVDANGNRIEVVGKTTLFVQVGRYR